MRKRTLISLILTIVMILTASGIASAADSWKYYFPITVSDNSSTTRTAYPIILKVGGDSLVNGGYLTDNGTDARLRTTADKNLLMSTDNIGFVVDSLPAYGQVTYNLYTGYSPEIDAFQIIVGDGGYVTVADNTTIELGDNFTVEQSGWITLPDAVADRTLLDFVRANSDWVSIPDSADLDFTDGNDEAGTIIVWVNFDDATSSTLLSKFLVAGNQRTWRFLTSGSDTLIFDCYESDGSGSIGRATASITSYEGEWVHLAATYNGSETSAGINLYINSVDADTVDVETLPYTGISDTTSVVELGSTGGGTSVFLDGKMAEAKIYKATLTPAEILADYNGGHRATNLEAWWRLDEGTGNPQDSSGNGHNATANLADWETGTGYEVIGHLVKKPAAFYTTIDDDGNITSWIAGQTSVTAPAVTEGEHTVTTIADDTFFYIEHGSITWGNYAPPKTDLILNTPLWHAESDGSPFSSKDVNEESCTVTGANWTSDGYVFDGDDDFIACGNGTQLSFGDGTNDDPFTFHIWANVTNIAANRAFIQKEDAGNTKREYYFQYLTGGIYRLQLLDQSANKAATRAADADPATTGVMTLYSVTYDGGGGATAANGMVLYINGVTVASTASNDALYVAMEPFTDVPLYIGNRVDLDVDLLGTVGEAAIYDQVQTPAEVLAYHDATKWQYDGSTEYFYYQLIGAGVPDTAFDLTFVQNNVMPYADYITISVNGTQELWFQPNAMITGTTLPDRATSVANDGTITWGANDQVFITFGGVTSYEATVSVVTTNVTGFVLPLVGIPDNWWGMEFDGEDLPFYPTFLDTSTQTGIPLQTLYLLVVFGAAIALATVTIVLTRSVVVGVAFYTITMTYGANAGIVAWWIIYVFLIMVIGIIFLSSRQAMGG